MENRTKPIKILFVEDLPSDVEIAKREIKKENIDFISHVVDTESEFRLKLSEFKPDIIISDYSMPLFDGMRALKITRSIDPIKPFVVLTGSMNEETAVACMKAGANDYVIKEQIKRLPFAVIEAIEKGKIQKELLASEAKYRSLIENSNDAIYFIYNRKFEIVNRRFEEMFGYDIEELNQKGFDFINLVAPESRAQIEDRLRKIDKGEQVKDIYEFTSINKKGERREVEASVSYIDHKQDKGIQGIIRDISERKKMISELVEAKEKAEESDRLKTAFLANISHEIRTPMNGIMGFTEILRDHDLPVSQQQEFVEIIQNSGIRMLETIDNLIDISKIETGQEIIQISEINIHEQLEEIVKFFDPEVSEKGLRLNLNNLLPAKISTVKTDSQKLHSILSNLIKNAIKFTEEGEIVIGCKLEKACLVFFVKDNGCGIPENKQEVVFERFVQADVSNSRSFEGSGLGLSIAKSYTEMLGGEIWVESQEANGSTFYFSIPLYDGETADQSPETSLTTDYPESRITRNLKILIAEDDMTGFIYLSTLLDKIECTIMHATTGDEAVRLCRENPDTDLILMDIKMPVMNGHEATRAIRGFNKDVVIIAQTAYALKGDKQKALDSGCNDYIPKPVTGKTLFNKIKRLTSS